MSTQKQLIALIATTASLVSFLAGYLFVQPAYQSAGITSQQRGNILDRFNGLVSSSIPTDTLIAGSLFRVTSDSTLSATNDPTSDSVLYYHRDTGLVSRVGLSDHASTLVSSTALPHLVRISWSPDKKKVVSVYSSSKGRVYKYFDYDTREQATLGTDIIDAVFSPDSQWLALAKVLGGETDIIIAQSNGDTPKTILKTRLNDMSLAWPSDHVLSLLVQSSDTADFYTLTDTGDLTKILDSQAGLKILWSTDGSQLLYSTTTNSQTVLTIRTVVNGEERTVSLATQADWCSWFLDSKSFVCAVEQNDNTSIQNVSVADLATKTLASDLIFTPENIFLSHLEDFVILINRADHSVYAIKLPN